MIKNVLKVSALVLVIGLATGCASTAQVEAAQAAADAAAADAASAVSIAEAARAEASAAAVLAAEAAIVADEALIVGAAGVECCEANRETMDRMFQKTMAK